MLFLILLVIVLYLSTAWMMVHHFVLGYSLDIMDRIEDLVHLTPYNGTRLLLWILVFVCGVFIIPAPVFIWLFSRVEE